MIKNPCIPCLLFAMCQQEVKQQDFFVGTVRVNGRMDWPMLDSAVSQAFKVSLRPLTASFNVTCLRTECTVCIKHAPRSRSSCRIKFSMLLLQRV